MKKVNSRREGTAGELAGKKSGGCAVLGRNVGLIEEWV
jgi:hypothetical protein